MTKLEHALALAARGFYVFPITPGLKAPPVVKDWQAWATRDTLKITRVWEGNPKLNIGISTSKFGNGQALLVVDVDVKGKKNGFDTLLEHELQGRELAPTVEQRTPSGGMHYLYVVDVGVRQGANVLGPGVDTRSAGGYIVGAGSTTEAGEYSISGGVLAPAPEWIVERCGAARHEPTPAREQLAGVDAESATARAIHYLTHEAPLAVEGEGGDETTYKVAARLKDLGLHPEEAVDALLEYWNPRCSPPWSLDGIELKVANAYAYGKEPLGVAAPEVVFPPIEKPDTTQVSTEPMHPFDELNREFAFVIVGGSGHVIWETTDADGKPSIEHLNLGAFHQKFASKKLMVGKQEKRLTDLWMESPKRRSYDGIVFRPGQPPDVVTE